VVAFAWSPPDGEREQLGIVDPNGGARGHVPVTKSVDSEAKSVDFEVKLVDFEVKLADSEAKTVDSETETVHPVGEADCFEPQMIDCVSIPIDFVPQMIDFGPQMIDSLVEVPSRAAEAAGFVAEPD
jgi:hypothetical protein